MFVIVFCSTRVTQNPIVGSICMQSLIFRQAMNTRLVKSQKFSYLRQFVLRSVRLQN